MCTFFESYLGFRLGSEDLAMGVGCDDRYSGLTAKWPAAGCDEGMMWCMRRMDSREGEEGGVAEMQ